MGQFSTFAGPGGRFLSASGRAGSTGPDACLIIKSNMLPSAIIKVAITGPESTGKSTLAQQLAGHYRATWVPEFARTYIAGLCRQYTPADVEQIARGQLARYQQVLSQASGFVFADTDLLVIKIWMLHAYGFCPEWILQALEQQEFDLYLLMQVDLPWEDDPQREHPHLRPYFYNWYKRELQAYGFTFVEIAGSQQNRRQHAIEAIDHYISENSIKALKSGKL
jgi:NadR type nicotinamide-nucleotide adenylyltransferase